MVLAREAAIGPLDVIGGGVSRYAQYLVVILELHQAAFPGVTGVVMGLAFAEIKRISRVAAP
jgi:hypothetical protein